VSTATYRIAEVARRSGFSPPTLRYYEEIGLLAPPDRNANGYRVYDDGTLDRLSFISRAKQLGCSLDEIAELATAWDGGRCAPVQQRLRDMVDAKVSDAQARISELVALVGELRGARADLEAHTPDGPCDDDCGCTAAATSGGAGAAGGVAPTPVPLVAKPAVGPGDPPPIACTLGASDLDQRLGDWQALLAQVTIRTEIEGGLRLTFEPDVAAETIARLAAAEQDCCRFFSFALTFDAGGTALEVRAPADGQAVLTSLFGTPDQG
jgi:MerR family transcriptional regulator, copper efflux regulator